MSAVLDESKLIAPCSNCGHELYQPTLRATLKQCPRCHPSELPYNPDALRRLARTERKRLKAQVAVYVTRLFDLSQLGFRDWPSHLVTTVRVLDRWGSYGTGMPAQNPDVYRQSLPVPLNDDTQAVVTACVGPDPMARRPPPCIVPARVRLVTYDIWWRGAPASFVGQKIGMQPRSFGRYIEECVGMHRRSFLGSGHEDLVALIGERP